MINKTDKQEKTWLNQKKRLDEIRKIIYNLPWRELEKSEHVGWFIAFTLTSQGMKAKESKDWLRIIEVCEPNFWLPMKDAHIISQIRQNTKFTDIRPFFMTRRLLDGRAAYAGPSLRDLTEKQFLELPEDLRRSQWRSFSRYEYWEEKVRKETVSWGGALHEHKTYEPKIPEEYLSVKVRKRIVTHIQDIDPRLLSEQKELEDKLEGYWRTRPQYRGRYRPDKVRGHVKAAINHLKKGDIDDINNYNKIKRTW